MSNEFKTIIGLEVHIELSTSTKMFCACSNDAQGKSPNELLCPICLGMPGTLPVANKQAIIYTIKMGLALDCEIAKLSKFDRKHYFYPDLPKGYQISQYDQPFCLGGHLIIGEDKIRLNRIHLEEDAGKLTHGSHGVSQVDLNRAGTPLMEIVTEPDITSPEVAKEFLREIQLIARMIGVSAADMEKGHMRCDANINVIKDDKSSPIVEIKNLNSFKFVQKALEFEKSRLIEEFDTFDGKKTKQTRGFDSNSGKTYALRSKEEAKDYRYFPEPDLPPIDTRLDPDFDPEIISKSLPKLPSALREEFVALSLSSESADKIIKDGVFLELFLQAIAIKPEYAELIANLILNDKTMLDLSAEALVDLAGLIKKENISSNIARSIARDCIKSKKMPSQCFGGSGGDLDLEAIVAKILDANPDEVQKVKNGKKEVIGFLVGQGMKEYGSSVDPNQLRQKIIDKIS
jgi:aspartyl-tRNA(Asn)/glutamyl-tRNA(Gln) amidotransferase subunit B